MSAPQSSQSSPFSSPVAAYQAAQGPGMRDLGLLIMRLGFGGFMMAHGWGKVQMVLNDQADQFGDPIGLGNTISLYGAAGAEFVAAAAVIVGFMTRFAAIPVVATMAVAAFVVHGSHPLIPTMVEGAQGPAMSFAKEPALLFGLAFLGLALTGPGRISIDAKLARRKAAGK